MSSENTEQKHLVGSRRAMMQVIGFGIVAAAVAGIAGGWIAGLAVFGVAFTAGIITNVAIGRAQNETKETEEAAKLLIKEKDKQIEQARSHECEHEQRRNPVDALRGPGTVGVSHAEIEDRLQALSQSTQIH